MSYVVKRKIRKYRKNFVMPVLTSNGTMGGNTFAVACSKTTSTAYEVFNGGADGTKNIDTLSNAAPQWVSFYNPVPLKVTKLRVGQIKITSEQNNYYITSWKIQVSDDNETWTDVWNGTGSKPATTLTANIEDSGYHKYYRVYVNSAAYYSGYPRVFFGGIDFEAEAEDAVFYDDIVKSYVAKRKIRRYYKKQYQDFVQPVFTNVTSVNSGGDGPSIAEIKYNGQEYIGDVEVSADEYAPVTEGYTDYSNNYTVDKPKVTQVDASDLYKVYWDSLKDASGTYTEPAYTSYIKKTEFDALANESLLTQYNEDGSLFANPKPMYKVNQYLTSGESYRIGSPDYFFEDVIKSYVIGRK